MSFFCNPPRRLRWVLRLAALPLALAGCHAPLESLHDGRAVLRDEIGRVRGFDPVKVSDVPSAIAICRVYETLLQYSYLDRPYRLEPLLAAAMPDVSADGLVYTFHLRPGIFFQDDPCFTSTAGQGRELVAEDFVYSIKRVADLKNASNGYWAFNDRIVGLDEFREQSGGAGSTDYGSVVDGLRAIDRHALRLVLKRPYPQFLFVLAMHYAAAVPREAVEFYGAEFPTRPVGTGPFVLRSWIRNYRMEFARNPKWAQTGRREFYPAQSSLADQEAGLLQDAGQPLPLLDGIVSYVISDPASKWLTFLTGGIDVSDISRDNWGVVITEGRALSPDLKARGIDLRVVPTIRIGYLGFNMEDPVVGPNRALRQALSCAFNTRQWIQYNNDRIVRPNGPIPEGLAGYVDEPSPYDFDLDQARRLLAEAGYAEGQDPATGRRLQLTLEVGRADDPETRQAMELVANFMSQIGVVLNVSYNNWPTFLDKLDRRQAQMYSLSWLADYPDAENFLQCFYGANSSPGPNHSNYVNPEFDRLYEEARSLPDSPARTRLYQRMSALVVEDCPWIFTSQPLSYSLRHGRLRNAKPHDFPYGMEKYLGMEKEAGR